MTGTVTITLHVSGVTEIQARNLKTNLPAMIGGLAIVYDQVSYQSDAS